ncbi:MAG: hypothetical protein RR933_06010, partial [Oscillospiraceae bacterium]
KQAEEISETDYPNKRRYNAACKLAVESATCSDDERAEIENDRYRFITENADTLIAANYLTPTGDFLYSQAIKDNFKVPVTLPDEDETREFDFRKILQKIARKDIPLCLEVWAWCLEQFLPYVGYDISSKDDLTNDIIYYINEFSDEFPPALIRYMGEHPDFRTKVIAEAEPAISELAELITDAIKQNSLDTAKALFIDGLTAANGKWQEINRLTDNIIYNSKTYSELETIEYAEQELLPLVKTYQDGMILDEIEVWEESITKYKLQMEQTCDQYAYTRSNSWRKTVPDGKEYRLDPVNYKSEEKYLGAFNREKYRWRQTFNSKETCGLNPEDYETKDAFLEDLSPKMRENKTHGLANIPPMSDDKTIYTYCGVALSFSVRPYFFRTNDTTIKIGDTVTVPIGKTQQEFEGTVVSIGQYTLRAAPYPVEMTKFISKKIEKE